MSQETYALTRSNHAVAVERRTPPQPKYDVPAVQPAIQINRPPPVPPQYKRHQLNAPPMPLAVRDNRKDVQPYKPPVQEVAQPAPANRRASLPPEMLRNIKLIDNGDGTYSIQTKRYFCIWVYVKFDSYHDIEVWRGTLEKADELIYKIATLPPGHFLSDNQGLYSLSITGY